MKRYIVWYKEPDENKTHRYGSTLSRDRANEMISEIVNNLPYGSALNESHGGGKNLKYKSDKIAWYTVHNT